jgi:hypothetical protein
MLWRFSASNTHLYPGAFLRSLEAPDETRLSTGDGVLVEFSDGVFVNAQLLDATPTTATLQIPGYHTRRGTMVAARTWRIVPADKPGLVRVQERLSR